MSGRAGPVEAPAAKQRRGRPSKSRVRRRAEQIPEPREVLAAPGRPLDPGVRRALEERLGQDFSQVRIHADAEAAGLTELLGADAVAVGSDVFFAAGAYRPETAAGLRLLAHELIHTVQVPDGGSRLRVGRETALQNGFGAVSDPLEPVELAAETAADAVTASGAGPDSDPASGPAVVEPGPVAASWLRYASVTAEQRRTELLDPATLMDRLVSGVLRTLRGDPADASGRARMQLARMAPELRADVLQRIQLRLPSTEYADLVERVEESDGSYDAGATSAGQTPEPVWSGSEDLDRQRELLPEFGQDPDAGKAQDQENTDQKDPDQKDLDQKDPDQKDPDQKDPDQKNDDRKDQTDENQKNENQKDADPKNAEQKDKGQEDKDQKAEADGKDQQAAQDEREPGDDKTAPDHAQVDGQPAPPATGVPPGAAGSAAPASIPAPVAASPDTATGGGSGVEPVSAAPVEQELTGDQSPLVRHGVLARRGQTEVPTPDELPLGLEPGATDEITLPDVEPTAEADPAPGPPPDLLPSTDLDVSSVPTAADELALPASGSPPSPKPVPSFPAPPKLSSDAEAYLADEAAGPAAQASREHASDAEDQRAATEFDQSIAAEPEPSAADPVQDPAAATADEAPSASGGFQPVSYTSSSTGTGFRTTDLGTGDLSPGDFGTADVDTGPQAFDQGDGPSFDQGPDAGESLTGPGALPQDASLEPGGGECGGGPASEPAEAGAAACGAGGEPATAEPEPAVPDVSAEEPESGLSTIEQLPPDQMQVTLVSVNSAVTTTVSHQRTALADAPPQMDRPAGASQTLNGPPTVSAPGEYPGDKVQKIHAARSGKTPEVQGALAPTGENPADQVDTPSLFDVGKAIFGAIVGSIAGKVEKALGILPVKDAGLANATVGIASKVPLKDDTDPNLANQQKDQVLTTGHQLRQAGRQDAAQPMGEDQVYPTFAPEVLQADVGAGAPVRSGGPAAGPGAAPGGKQKVVGLIAAQERGPDIQAGFVQGRTQMSGERTTQQTSSQQAQTDYEQEVATEIAAGTDEQTTVRDGTVTEVGQARQSWNDEQDGHVQTLSGKATENFRLAVIKIKSHQEQGDTEIDRKTADENARIEQERKNAEEEAARKKDEGKKDSGNWLTRAGDAIKDAFNKVKNAIKAAFDKARKAVMTIIDDFKKAAFAIIDKARNAIIGTINTLADGLIALGDVALSAFPEARDKWRGYINNKRDAAIKKVNEAADNLKANIAKALDVFGKLLTGFLDLLEKGLLAAVSMVEDAVNKGLKFAESLIALVGEWADLVVDIAANPGGWLSNLGTAAKEGVQHHLWGALKTAVKQWFNDKVESVLGLGKLLWNVLIKGCMSVKEIGKMAWQAVLSALPMMIIALVIEKLVSLIVPAAGAIMTIIQGLMAAWGTISRIIAALSTFFAFLKAVKKGGVTAACLFAQSVAAGAVVLLDFIANFLLVRLGKALKKVASKLKGLAQKVIKGLKRGGKSKKRADGGSVNRARNDMERAGKGSKRDIEAGAVPRNRPGRHRPGKHRAPGDRTPGSRRNPLSRARQAVSDAARRARDTARRLGNRFRRSPVGRALTNGPRRLKDWYQQQKDRYHDHRNRGKDRDRDKNDKNRAEAKDARLARVVARIHPRIHRVLSRGIRTPLLKAVLKATRAWYRLTDLRMVGSSAFAVEAVLNPKRNADDGRAAQVRKDLVSQLIKDIPPMLRVQATNVLKESGLSEWVEGHIDEFSISADQPVHTLSERMASSLAARIDSITEKQARAESAREDRWLAYPTAGNGESAPRARGVLNEEELQELLQDLNRRMMLVKGNSEPESLTVGVRGSAVTGQSSNGGLFRWAVPAAEAGRYEKDHVPEKPSDVDFLVADERLEELLDSLQNPAIRWRQNEQQSAGLERLPMSSLREWLETVEGEMASSQANAQRGQRPRQPPRGYREVSSLFNQLEEFGHETTRQIGRKGEAMLIRRRILESLNETDFIVYTERKS